jgi:tRNA(adenine34) deaminase
MTQSDESRMREALVEARAAAEAGEVPIGAIAVAAGEIVARGQNRVLRDCDPTAHAEMVALRAAAQAVGNYRLTNCELYVTLEPCAMCAGALLAARAARLVFGTADPKAGACGSLYNLCADPRLNHELEVVRGIRAGECASLLEDFFASRR